MTSFSCRDNPQRTKQHLSWVHAHIPCTCKLELRLLSARMPCGMFGVAGVIPPSFPQVKSSFLGRSLHHFAMCLPAAFVVHSVMSVIASKCQLQLRKQPLAGRFIGIPIPYLPHFIGLSKLFLCLLSLYLTSSSRRHNRSSFAATLPLSAALKNIHLEVLLLYPRRPA